MTELAARLPGLRRRPLARFVARRLAASVATLFVVSILVFAGTEILPGDAASAVLGKTATPDQLAEMRHLMGLDRPVPERYLDWLGGLLTGDLGDSAAGFAAGGEAPILDQIRGKIGNSFILAAIVTVLMIPLALVLGVKIGRAHV